MNFILIINPKKANFKKTIGILNSFKSEIQLTQKKVKNQQRKLLGYEKIHAYYVESMEKTKIDKGETSKSFQLK